MFIDMSPVTFYLVVAVVLISAELLVMQFSVFWFLFFGVGALLAALAGWLIPEAGWYLTTGVFLLGSIATAALFFPPLRKWQKKPGVIAGNDAIGQRVKIIEPITATSEGKVEWSGSDWPARLHDDNDGDLAEGDMAVIKKLEGIRLFVGR